MKYSIKDLVNLLGCEIKGDLSLEYVSGLAPFFKLKRKMLHLLQMKNF